MSLSDVATAEQIPAAKSRPARERVLPVAQIYQVGLAEAQGGSTMITLVVGDERCPPKRHGLRASRADWLALGRPGQGPPAAARRDAGGAAMSRHVLVYINGILAAPGASDGWTDRAVTWTHLHTDFRAEKLEYFTGVVTRRIRQQARAEKFARMLERYAAAGYTFSLVGHSNGCDLILRIAHLLAGARAIRHLHLVAAAAEANFERSGLTQLMAEGTVGRVQVYTSRRDGALRIAHATARPLGWLGLGYGSLGLTGPHWGSVADASRVTVIDRPGYGHSTWWADEMEASPSLAPRHTPFEQTMRSIADFELFHAGASAPV